LHGAKHFRVTVGMAQPRMPLVHLHDFYDAARFAPDICPGESPQLKPWKVPPQDLAGGRVSVRPLRFDNLKNTWREVSSLYRHWSR
jgi:hypothetical protein